MRESRAISYSFVVLAFLLLNFNPAQAIADIVTDWDSFTSEEANGRLNGIDITGTRIEGAPFSNLVTGPFSGSKWSAGMALSPDAEAIILQPVNGGAEHQFSFSSPMSSVLFYVSNFDSSSDAIVSAEGAITIEMITGSSTMFYNPISSSSGRLHTSNDGFDGIADAVLRLSGDVQSIHMQYSDGIGNNGIGYTFVAVPEPASLIFCSMGLALTLLRRRRGEIAGL